jgi:hypothetical protein
MPISICVRGGYAAVPSGTRAGRRAHLARAAAFYRTVGGDQKMGDTTRDDGTDDRTSTHRRRYDPASDPSPSETLVLALADLFDADPLALEPLYETVAPDALDEFVTTGGRSAVDGHLSFTYADCEVTVHASGLFEFRLRN